MRILIYIEMTLNVKKRRSSSLQSWFNNKTDKGIFIVLDNDFRNSPAWVMHAVRLRFFTACTLLKRAKVVETTQHLVYDPAPRNASFSVNMKHSTEKHFLHRCATNFPLTESHCHQ